MVLSQSQNSTPIIWKPFVDLWLRILVRTFPKKTSTAHDLLLNMRKINLLWDSKISLVFEVEAFLLRDSQRIRSRLSLQELFVFEKFHIGCILFSSSKLLQEYFYCHSPLQVLEMWQTLKFCKWRLLKGMVEIWEARTGGNPSVKSVSWSLLNGSNKRFSKSTFFSFFFFFFLFFLSFFHFLFFKRLVVLLHKKKWKQKVLYPLLLSSV